LRGNDDRDVCHVNFVTPTLLNTYTTDNRTTQYRMLTRQQIPE